MSTLEKKCTKCLAVLPIESFSAKRGNPHGMSWCRSCNSARKVAWSHTPRGHELILRSNSRYDATPERKAKQAANKRTDKRIEHAKAYRRSAAGQVVERRLSLKYEARLERKAYKATLKRTDEYRKKGRDYGTSDAGKASRRRFERSDKGRSLKIKRRATMREIISTMTNQDWMDIQAAYNFACAYCHATDRELTRDHVVSIANGGHDVKENIVPACRSCNSRKNARNAILTENGYVFSNN